MLAIKQKFHIPYPHLTLSHKVEFSPIEVEADELIAAIDNKVSETDDDWQLEERPDTKELAQYWDKVEDDIQHDPKWIKVED